MKHLWLLFLCFLPCALVAQERLRIVEWNVENLFDIEHDSEKNDLEFTPNSPRHWTRTKYWEKLNKVGQGIISCGEDSARTYLPDLIGLCEVENDSTMIYLTQRSLLRKARYQYIMTASNDERGIDVALLYSPFTFRIMKADTIHIPPLKEMKPTRDILHVMGELVNGDTLHVILLHAPSRSGGAIFSEPFRIHVATQLCNIIDSIKATAKNAKIITMGDFNDYADDKSLQKIYEHGMTNISQNAMGKNGAKGTYRYRGEWGSLDQILVSTNLVPKVQQCRINDAPFLLEEDTKYGGVKPRRCYNGMRYNGGFSDHLPLVFDLLF